MLPFTSPGIAPGTNQREIGHDGYDHIRPVRGCTRIAGSNGGANEPRDRLRAKRSVNCLSETPRCDGYIPGFPTAAYKPWISAAAYAIRYRFMAALSVI
jgi:hypothetical protein